MINTLAAMCFMVFTHPLHEDEKVIINASNVEMITYKAEIWQLGHGATVIYTNTGNRYAVADTVDEAHAKLALCLEDKTSQE